MRDIYGIQRKIDGKGIHMMIDRYIYTKRDIHRETYRVELSSL